MVSERVGVSVKVNERMSERVSERVSMRLFDHNKSTTLREPKAFKIFVCFVWKRKEGGGRK
jgi:hypothetical protein